MNRGKDICKELKAVRRRIAEENDIALEIPECTYNGPCKGTCPRCESEVRFLENELTKRIKLGKVASVAGLALGLALSSGVKAQSMDTLLRQPEADTSPNLGEEITCGTLKGRVFDLKTGELLPFCKVVLRQGDTVVASGVTDFDGMYTLNKIPFGDYLLDIQQMGYVRFEQGVTVAKQGFTVMDVSLAADTTGIPSIVISGPVTIGTSAKEAPRTKRVVVDGDKLDYTIEEMAREARMEELRPMMGEIQVHLPGTEASRAGDPPPIPKHVMDGKLVGAIGVPNLDGVPSTVRVVRQGPLLIVDETDEPEL